MSVGSVPNVNNTAPPVQNIVHTSPLHTTVGRIVGLAVLIFASMLSFMILPPQGALIVTTILVILYFTVHFPKPVSNIRSSTTFAPQTSNIHVIHTPFVPPSRHIFTPPQPREFVPFPDSSFYWTPPQSPRVVPGQGHTNTPSGHFLTRTSPQPPQTANRVRSGGGHTATPGGTPSPSPAQSGVQPLRVPAGRRDA